ncbi:uncharacterized protein CcaverHIS019_0702920 [Cutaneotrichosporon cavernicola]|uniref:Uncharacterized protein n=1 Tax=Cutaneotrichosporon cavernicola TaxID=279322 RepID=A0AA48QYT7_9TREE|nr:uncharacterized protein CcaverHIS019_0702920 [Cutaneotrichosporon cavernicola]BEI94711.1 hypothetical protein CcaverHIS019_0702920 [Cutaneotrichosporon cavernicola]BEJ02486.1 hypothetical protein CcaverHIS631_0702810 [Cutaneotrichosporon cavernicola]
MLLFLLFIGLVAAAPAPQLPLSDFRGPWTIGYRRVKLPLQAHPGYCLGLSAKNWGEPVSLVFCDSDDAKLVMRSDKLTAFGTILHHDFCLDVTQGDPSLYAQAYWCWSAPPLGRFKQMLKVPGPELLSGGAYPSAKITFADCDDSGADRYQRWGFEEFFDE